MKNYDIAYADAIISQHLAHDAIMVTTPQSLRAPMQTLLKHRTFEIPQSLCTEDAKQQIESAFNLDMLALQQLLKINQLFHQRVALTTHNWQFGKINTPIGPMLAIFSDNGLSLLSFLDQKALFKDIERLFKTRPSLGLKPATSALTQLQQDLDAYFLGKRFYFSQPLDYDGTEFQCRVWHYLSSIPYGTTVSYKTEATALQQPRAVRAVAAANGQNNISIIIPCHRVIGSNGKLTGYGGGLSRKAFLLALEQTHCVNTQ